MKGRAVAMAYDLGGNIPVVIPDIDWENEMWQRNSVAFWEVISAQLADEYFVDHLDWYYDELAEAMGRTEEFFGVPHHTDHIRRPNMHKARYLSRARHKRDLHNEFHAHHNHTKEQNLVRHDRKVESGSVGALDERDLDYGTPSYDRWDRDPSYDRLVVRMWNEHRAVEVGRDYADSSMDFRYIAPFGADGALPEDMMHDIMCHIIIGVRAVGWGEYVLTYRV